MVTLFYGNGTCSIDGSLGVRGVQIHHTGNIHIKDKTPDNFHIAAKNNKIIIFPLENGYLTELFDYSGEFKVNKVIAAGDDGVPIYCYIKKVMEYAGYINSFAEDIDTNSEDLGEGYISNRKVENTIVDRPIIENRHTNELSTLYNEDGSKYTGFVHIHINTGEIMTGKKHTESSKLLFTKAK